MLIFSTDFPINVTIRDGHAGAAKCAKSKYSRIYARISRICANMRQYADMCIDANWKKSGAWPSLVSSSSSMPVVAVVVVWFAVPHAVVLEYGRLYTFAKGFSA